MTTEREAMLKSMSQPAKATPHSPTPTHSTESKWTVDNLEREMEYPASVEEIVDQLNAYAALQAENAELREALIQVRDICYIEGGDYAAGLEMAVNIAKEALTRPPEVK